VSVAGALHLICPDELDDSFLGKAGSEEAV
jgi:hypothetical protein